MDSSRPNGAGKSLASTPPLFLIQLLMLTSPQATSKCLNNDPKQLSVNRSEMKSDRTLRRGTVNAQICVFVIGVDGNNKK
jgi:hypothetical protein